VGARGATVLLESVRPEYCLVVDGEIGWYCGTAFVCVGQRSEPHPPCSARELCCSCLKRSRRRTVSSARQRVIPYDRAVFVRERSFNDEATKRGVGVHRTPAVDLVGRVAVCDRGREGGGRGLKDLNGYGCCSKQQAQAGCAAHLFRKSRRESLMATLRI
jgi:hypothetical protein